MPQCWINGQLTDDASATVSIRDTGLLHAAGVFTTMRAYHGKAFALDRHLARLRRSAESLLVPLEYSDAELTAAVSQLLKANDLTDARLRLTITRGTSASDPTHGLHLSPTAILTATALDSYPPEQYRNGITALAYDRQKLNPYDIQAGHKTLDYFSRLTALRDATGRGAGEALLFNVHNYLQSGCISNVFIVKNGTLFTPPTQDDLLNPEIANRTEYPRSNVLPGITRSIILELAATAGVPIQISRIDVNQLLSADECFVSNSIMELLPICRIERKALGADKPGPLTAKLSMLYRSQVSTLCQQVV